MSGNPSTEFAPKLNGDGPDYFGYYPGAVAVISSRHGPDINVMSAGWHTALSQQPPLYGVAIAPERFSYRLVKESGQFVVNFLPFSRVEAVAGAGLLSGKDVDKYSRLDLSWTASARDLPLLDDAYMSYECEVVDEVETGDHSLFVGAIQTFHYLPQAFEGRVQNAVQVPPVAYYGRSTYEALGSGQKKVLPPQLFRDNDRKA